ncbi:polyprenyl synthetase family protein [Myxococcota bacterium]|nr:polyprenyl synthetase family protein [Myxococcota bacterium]
MSGVVRAITARAARSTAVAEHAVAARRGVAAFLDDLEADPRAALAPRFGQARVHLFREPGKLVRPMIVWLLGRSLGVEGSRLRPYAVVTELIHGASLLHDDVIDRALTRRGRPSANALYDNTLAVLAGDSILAEVTGRLAELGDLEVVRAVSATIQDLVAGESLQYELRGLVHADVRACVEVAELKTASLLSLCTWLPARIAGREDLAPDMAAIGRNTGISYQLTDDVLDFDAEHTGKPPFADWSEGKTNAVTAAMVGLHPEAEGPLADFFASEARRDAARCREAYGRLFPEAVREQALEQVRALAEEYTALADHHASAVPDTAEGRLFEQLRRKLLGRRS